MSPRKSEPGAKKPEMNPIKRHYEKPTRKTAITAFCCYCVGCTATEQNNGEIDHLEPGFRVYIRGCTALACPLYSYRPFQRVNAEK
jgi:hypothetical protein